MDDLRHEIDWDRGMIPAPQRAQVIDLGNMTEAEAAALAVLSDGGVSAISHGIAARLEEAGLAVKRHDLPNTARGQVFMSVTLQGVEAYAARKGGA